MEGISFFSAIPLDQLKQLLSEVIRQELKAQAEATLQEKLLSPDETCKLFSPAISRPTLESYASKGHFKKYYLEGRTWYKYSEVVAALTFIKRYNHH